MVDGAGAESESKAGELDGPVGEIYRQGFGVDLAHGGCYLKGTRRGQQASPSSSLA